MVKTALWAIALAAAFGQTVGPPGLESIGVAGMKADLAFLTSAPLGGRRATDMGGRAAAEWIASEFARHGLTPASSGGWFQRVPLIEYDVDLERTIGVLKHGKATRTFAYHDDFSTEGPTDADVDRPLLWAGYGITAPEYGYDDYANVDARGKIVIVMQHEPDETNPKSVFNGRGNTWHADNRVKIVNAQRHGAVGVLLVPEPNRKHPSSLDRRIRMANGVDRKPERAGSLTLDDDDVLIPMMMLRDSMLREILAAAGRNPQELQRAIDSRTRPMSLDLPGLSFRMRLVMRSIRRGPGFNVAALLSGSDPVLRDETVIVSAHFDHTGTPDGRMRPGADDNASGTAGMLAIARAFASATTRPRRSVLFLAFDAEEYPTLGSTYYVNHPLRPLATTRAVLNMDMIGRNETMFRYLEGYIEVDPDTSNQLNLVGTINCPGCRELIERENAAVGLSLSDKWNHEHILNVYDRSDHFPFWTRGIPAIWFFTGFHPDYHEPADTMEKINWIKMEKVTKLVYRSAWAIANASEPPSFTPKPGGAR